MKLSGDLQFKIALVLVAAGVAAFVIYKSPRIIASAAQAVNPFNNNNVINQLGTGIYQGVTGSDGSIGTDIFDGVEALKKRLNQTSEGMAADAEEYGYGWQI